MSYARNVSENFYCGLLLSFLLYNFDMLRLLGEFAYVVQIGKFVKSEDVSNYLTVAEWQKLAAGVGWSLMHPAYGH